MMFFFVWNAKALHLMMMIIYESAKKERKLSRLTSVAVKDLFAKYI